MHIPDELAASLGAITRIHAVAGGDISHAYKLETASGAWLFKTNPRMPHDFFAAEADGLITLREAHVIAVPQVHSFGNNWIALEWYAARGRYHAADLGAQLAQLHLHHAAQYGYHRGNYIGALAQPNVWHDDWATFWRDYRLMPQIRYADQARRLRGQRATQLDTLCNRIGDLIAHNPPKSLLHGDLWAGNVITAYDGKPALVDPAVSYGDPETDMAFAALFGGFGMEFEQAYQQAYPLPSDARDRRPLYQLYWLLVHLTLFGESYGASIDRILRRYV